MARIPETEIERIKQEVSVQRLAEARGIHLDRHGADLIGLCPFHEDHEPSLVITPAKNLWHCLGACRTGGSVIDWVMQTWCLAEIAPISNAVWAGGVCVPGVAVGALYPVPVPVEVLSPRFPGSGLSWQHRESALQQTSQSLPFQEISSGNRGQSS